MSVFLAGIYASKTVTKGSKHNSKRHYVSIW